MKSASHIACMCHVGALVATTDDELINNLTLFGHNLGWLHKSPNDIQGITQGNDLMKRKVSLPLIYALTQTGTETRNKIKRLY